MSITAAIPTRAEEPAMALEVTVVKERCAGCQECVVRCPTEALRMDVATWTVVADDDACVGCRQCERTCPFAAIRVQGAPRVAARTPARASQPAQLVGDLSETRHGFASLDEARREAARCLACPDPTCVRGCPAHNDIPGFIAAIAAGELGAAHEVLRRTTVLPDVCSRVCDQAIQCEGACSWSLAGGSPVAIGALERFVADSAPVPPPTRRSARGRSLSVAIVGSGPAAIAAAWELVEHGAAVTVLERSSKPGGLLGWGIPAFTLPRAVAGRAWDQLLAAGVALRCGVEVTPADLDDLLQRYDAVVLAFGAGEALRLPVPGGDLDGVVDATAFLTRAEEALREGGALPGLDPARASRDGAPPLVLVIGGGNTAMDVARSARRFGARALCVEWMDRRFAPVRPDELAEAEAEGVEVRFATTLAGLEGEGGRVNAALLGRTLQRHAGERPKLVPGSSERVRVDLVVMAMGYRNDPVFSAVLPGIPLRRIDERLADRTWQASGLLAVPAPTFARGRPVGRLALGREAGRVAAGLPRRDRVWVVGDALVGPSTVVEAMAHGRRAAQAILARQPSRPGASRRGGPAAILVAVESRAGRTRARAEQLAEVLRRDGAQVAVAPLDEVGAAQLAWADLLVVGTWVEGAVVANVRAARATRRWIASLGELGGLPVGIFCTYGLHPRGALAEMRRSFEARGARVVAEAAFGPRSRADVDEYARELVRCN
ncbi:MAG TPA: FAD-dependent oxidoreductase [Acidimicrobiales bacterium]|nr:FAD-dependent oxidoreductase [Acidimicrobiales bacterium]